MKTKKQSQTEINSTKILNEFMNFLKEVIVDDYALLSCVNPSRMLENQYLCVCEGRVESDLVSLGILPARLLNYFAESSTISLRIYKGGNHFNLYGFLFFIRNESLVIESIPAHMIRQKFMELNHCLDENIEFKEKHFIL
ncbi:MAG TPA: hypothetical protein VNW06_02110 [Cytophagaceae bacterium]|nr:hypothetical protein [Cytophagaceae bacterium]